MGTARTIRPTFTNWIPSAGGYQQDTGNGHGMMAAVGSSAQEVASQSPRLPTSTMVTAPTGSSGVTTGSAINPGVTGAAAANATGVGLSGPQNAAKVLGTLQNKAIGGFNSLTSGLTSASTQGLLKDPSAGFNPNKYAVQQKDVFASNQAKALEAARQAGANVANTGAQQGVQQSAMLQSALDRANFGSTLDLSLAEKKKTDMQQALAEGRATTATEQAGYDTGIAALATARQAGEGEAERAVTVSQSDLDRQFEKDIESGRISEADKDRILDAKKFNSQQQYDKWALAQGISESERDRIWRSKEAVAERAWKSSEASADRALEQMGLDQNEQQLAQDALAAGDIATFSRWASSKGYSPEEIKISWENRESALDRAHEIQMQQMADENGEVGQVLQGLMFAAEQDPDNAPALMAALDKLAKENGIDVDQYIQDAETTALAKAQEKVPAGVILVPNKGSNESMDLQYVDSVTGDVYNAWGEVSRYHVGNQYLTPAEYRKTNPTGEITTDKDAILSRLGNGARVKPQGANWPVLARYADANNNWYDMYGDLLTAKQAVWNGSEDAYWTANPKV